MSDEIRGKLYNIVKHYYIVLRLSRENTKNIFRREIQFLSGDKSLTKRQSSSSPSPSPLNI